MVGIVMLMVTLFIRAASRKPLNRVNIDEGRGAGKSIGPMLTGRTLQMCMNSSRVFQKMEKLEGLGIPVFVQFNETAHAKHLVNIFFRTQLAIQWVKCSSCPPK